ncbi:hypothetical protein ABB37_06986 [Leptomonas pyrrhocoris]|uniref:Surface antigen-like protein n=1 Tax=Leptomonas pyrrhocoris TaxID=157538 RepID=A0A0M9FWX1_LEPPY|nr:hypothetical protein ABB37_06985 [Leptomonas pyrrhocoris]XP_015656069.1 hypothetical protein ABB37_06986 [Leptomonas pyrrhocoris]KPA77629.1 hypothetical protein ABB37_06985 [Leptomonas pyrrhocoris]KPA77630.1 hypothetical protein ABB37_06986 [Leptomonas pyrrhocoris]|eukprot:XP_015656068.1 hypothetical protein ABB37_06985 [Leptomonas pyrrhocoris]
MAASTTKFALLVVALALLASYASAACAIANCLNCSLANPNLCLVCADGYRLTGSGSCVSRVGPNGALAPQSMAVAAVVALFAALTYAL